MHHCEHCGQTGPTFAFMHSRRTIEMVPASMVVAVTIIESIRAACEMVLRDGRRLRRSGSLPAVCAIAGGDWLRVSRQWAVRPQALTGVNLPHGDGGWVEVPGLRVPVSRRYHAAVREAVFGGVTA